MAYPNSIKTSVSSTKPSFFCSSLEAFTKYSIYRKNTRLNGGELIDLAELNLVKDDVEPSLANWERWLKIHKQQQEELSLKIKRPPECMVMNSNLNNLYVNQEKHVIDEAIKLDICDKYRGHPNFWKTDNNFKNDGESLEVYQTIQERYDRSKTSCLQPQEVSYVGVPDAINNEKGLFGKTCLPTSKFKWDTSPAVKKKKEFLKEKLEIVQGFKPELSEVAVVGKGLKIAPEPSNQNQLNSATDNEEIDSYDPRYASTGFEHTTKTISNSSIFVMIGDQIVKGEQKLWTVLFENCFVGETYKKYVVIHNSKESSLRYSWDIVTYPWVDHDFPLRHVKNRSKCFYFDKSDGVILPGCEKKIMFYFQSTVAGVFWEKWEILLNYTPDKWESVIVELQAVAVEDNNSSESLQAIDSYIELCTKYTVARQTAKDILERSRQERIHDLPYNWNFFEEQVFVHNNPDLFYDSESVLLLKNLHEKLNKGPWDYCVTNLRKKLLERSSSENLGQDLEMFTYIIYQLMKPNVSPSLPNVKLKTVYELLCCFANKMEIESSHLKVVYSIPVELNKSGGEKRQLSTKSSVISAKLSARVNRLDKRASGKKSLSFSKIKSSLTKGSGTSNSSMKSDYSIQPMSVGDSTQSCIEHNSVICRRKQEYLEAMYIKTYYHLCQTIDNISAAIISFDAVKQKRVDYVLKDIDHNTL